MSRALPVAMLALCAGVCLAQDGDAVLEVKGQGVEGRPRYEGGGKVEFLDMSLADQLVHLAAPEPAEGARQEIPLRLSIKYNVLETAPVLLNSKLGSEYWRVYNYGNESMSGIHTLEQIDLSTEGEATATADRAWSDTQRGVLLSKGLAGIRGRYYFLIDQPDGQWLDVVQPPAFFVRRQLLERLTFTLANLSEFTLEFSEVQSTWEPGGPIHVKLTVTDADREQFPVLNCPATIEAQGWQAELTPNMDYLHIPTGWSAAQLPDGAVAEQVTARATVSAMTPDGPVTREVTGTFAKGTGRVTAEEMQIAEQGYELPRNAEGMIRETRALWIGPKDIMTREGVETLVAHAKEAGLNVLIPDIFVRSTFVARSDLFPMAEGVEEGLDPVAYLIEKAHEAGLEVHPWFCVTYRDSGFRKWFEENRDANVDMIDQDGEVRKLGADVHRPEYRDFIVDLMVGVARDYEVDGIHHDYIRTMGQCYCDKCRAEFQAQFGKPLTDATDEEWIAWQRQAVGEIVERVAAGVREVRPGAKLSAAVFSNLASGAAQGQDPAEWARQGWIDLVIPMDYQMQTLVVRDNEKQFLNALDDDDQLVTGLSLYMRSGAETTSRPPELVREQIELVRGMGIHGYCLFVHGHLSDEIIEMLKTDINSEPAVPYFR